jgi:hypothetical protein
VGEKDILNGHFMGYVAVFFYNMCEAGTLEYQSYMRRVKNYEPQCIKLSYFRGFVDELTN